MKTRTLSAAFTLIELIVVIAILGLLMTLLFPVSQEVFAKVHNTRCMNNLRQIGMSVGLYAAEHNDEIPKIETNPSEKIYSEEDDAKGMLETLRPYGLTEATVQCPMDIRGPNYFKLMGTSYEWRPMGDEEKKSNPTIYSRRGAFTIPTSRLRIANDFTPVHKGKWNRLYANGVVKGSF